MRRIQVKQTKINSRLAHQRRLDQIRLVQAEPREGTCRARVLGEADATVRQEQTRFDSPHRVFDQSFELLPLFVGDRGPQVLHLDGALADEDDLRNFVDAGYPGVAD